LERKHQVDCSEKFSSRTPKIFIVGSSPGPSNRSVVGQRACGPTIAAVTYLKKNISVIKVQNHKILTHPGEEAPNTKTRSTGRLFVFNGCSGT
jgi:hypothetical protein